MDKNTKKSIIALTISIAAIIILSYPWGMASRVEQTKSVSEVSSISNDFHRYTIIGVRQQGDTYIATINSLNGGGTIDIDITHASVDEDLDDLVGSILYWGDPSKHGNNPAKFLLIKNK